MTSELALGRGVGVGDWGTLESGGSKWREQSYASEMLLSLLWEEPGKPLRVEAVFMSIKGDNSDGN